MNNMFLLWKNFLFPRPCAICGGSLLNASEVHFGLCEQCLKPLLTEEKDRCIKCGKPLVSEIEICILCRNTREHSYEKIWVFFPYSGKYRKLLTEFKFHRNLALANLFTEKISAVLNEPELINASLVPVPVRPGKIREKGWDQVDYLVKKLKKNSKSDLFVSNCLKRKKSKIQKMLNRTDRIENLKGRIYSSKKSPKTALIIDDVITTGSTLEICSSVLKENGAEKVYCLCLFYD
ncbi:MAG: ComF family protein [Treponema sp.]|nr:ComF family protein [Treponema sp.]